MKCLPAVSRFWSSLTPWRTGRTMCLIASRGRHKLGLRIGQPGDQRARPPFPLPRSHSGSSCLQAGPRRPHTHPLSSQAASLPQPLPPSLPPSSPFPSPCSRVHTAPPGQPRAWRARALALGPPPLPLPAAPFAARSRLGSHQRPPDGTRRKQLASIPRRPPDAPPGPGRG